jgi:hypothetical protein
VRERLPSLRLLARPRRLLCLLPLPGGADDPVRALALVASPARPYLRRLTVFRRPGRAPIGSDTPRAA